MLAQHERKQQGNDTSAPIELDSSPPPSPRIPEVSSDMEIISISSDKEPEDPEPVSPTPPATDADSVADEDRQMRNPSFDREPTEDPPLQEPRTYGFAVIEVHPQVVRVLRWDPEADDGNQEPTPWQRDVFLLAEWLANMGGSDRDRERYFTLRAHRNNLPWKNLHEMYEAIDTFAFTPKWTHQILRVETEEGFEILDVYMRDILTVIKFLIGLRRLREYIHYSSERHWTVDTEGIRIRVYDELWSGNWWWQIQFLIPCGGVAIPVLVATDPTQLTMISGDKVACPVYATIGNISKDIRAKPSEHAWLLIGYIPVASLDFIENEERRREKKWEVYHAVMALILGPLKRAGDEGMEARCADGGVRMVYPFLAVKLADWPERCTGECSQATRCPVCVTPFRDRGSLVVAPLRTKEETLQLLLDSMDGYSEDRKAAGLRPTYPYWAQLPFANGADATVPDPLHQIHKGLFKAHLFTWWQKIIGKVELNNRFKALPRTHSVRHFVIGPCSIRQWTGIEARQAEKSFFPIIASHTSHRAVFATRTLMDIFFRLHQHQVDDNDLARMENDLQGFHRNKEIFRRMGAFTSRWSWNGLPGLHMASHYARQIRQFGTTDNYDTEIPERLHRHYVKNPYHQSGKSNPIPQMIYRLQRRENWAELRSNLERAGLVEECQYAANNRLADDVDSEIKIGAAHLRADVEMAPDGEWICWRDRHVYRLSPQLVIANRPFDRQVSVADINNNFNAPDFLDALSTYLDTERRLSYLVDATSTFAVWTRCELHHRPLPFAPLDGGFKDVIRTQPGTLDIAGRTTRQPYFDCALIHASSMHEGLFRYQAVRVRVIFQVPIYLRNEVPDHLALVEMFAPFNSPPRIVSLATTKPLTRNGRRVIKVIPLRLLRIACHLVPKYSEYQLDTRTVGTTDSLSVAPVFYLSRHHSPFFWNIMDHWRRVFST
ncbi:unnamed protein product [Rhizoctonia solani]|uniref:Uncharacterized protein n=1 Tax=Rhizoctonia solani TaxID=456999 RepID=A0A8H3I3G1_9AGAM|nr:unnamed protein product [Rhizoctonia solani]